MADNSENPDDNSVEIDGDDAVIEGVSAHYEFGADDVMPAGGDNSPAVAEDVLPDTLVLLPLPGRPFFPGQVQPIGLNPDQWQETLQAIAKQGSLRSQVAQNPWSQRGRRPIPSTRGETI